MVINNAKFINLSKSSIVIDFDGTITSSNSVVTWNIISESKMLGLEYEKERKRLQDKYRPIELDVNIPDVKRFFQISKWPLEHLELLKKNGLSEEVYEIICDNINLMPRENVLEFFNILNKESIPTLIYSAGLHKPIVKFLEHNNCAFKNIMIIANKLKFQNNKLVGFDDKVIHSYSKLQKNIPSNVQYKILNRSAVIIGDQITDSKMLDEGFKIGFFKDNVSSKEFKKNFDVVIPDEEGFKKLIKLFK